MNKNPNEQKKSSSDYDSLLKQFEMFKNELDPGTLSFE